MKYCIRHACVYFEYFCSKCWNADPPHLRIRDECLTDAEWEYYKERGWVK